MSPRDSLVTYCRTRTSGGVARYPARSVFEYTLFLYFLYQYTCVYRKKSVPLQSLYRSFIQYIKISVLYPEDTPQIPRRYPNQCIWLYELAQKQSLNIFNISKYYTITLLHQFMSEITLHTTKTPKSYFLKKRLFLGGIGVV